VNTHIKIIDQIRTIELIGLIDPLTKIANRRGFENRLNAEWGRALRERTSISILLMDIDMFKNYNDSFGHQQGDTALKTFAKIASQTLKRSVDFVARWGGEEFIILLPDTEIDGAAEVAERLRKNVEDSLILTEEGTETRITVSIGVNSIVPKENISPDEFIRKADQALYKAKGAGRNRFVINEV
jgi:diguanylate cyclase (GGDEF)-like protein